MVALYFLNQEQVGVAAMLKGYPRAKPSQHVHNKVHFTTSALSGDMTAMARQLATEKSVQSAHTHMQSVCIPP